VCRRGEGRRLTYGNRFMAGGPIENRRPGATGALEKAHVVPDPGKRRGLLGQVAGWPSQGRRCQGQRPVDEVPPSWSTPTPFGRIRRGYLDLPRGLVTIMSTPAVLPL
jgi:hypothetical protein